MVVFNQCSNLFAQQQLVKVLHFVELSGKIQVNEKDDDVLTYFILYLQNLKLFLYTFVFGREQLTCICV
jgi:hypothetical protein